MKKKGLLLALAGLGSLVTGCSFIGSEMNGIGADDGRALIVTWCADSARDVSPMFVHAEATTSNPADFAVEVSIRDPDGGDPLIWTAIGGENGAAGGRCYVNDALHSIQSGTSVTVEATFKNQDGGVNSTRRTAFVKP